MRVTMIFMIWYDMIWYDDADDDDDGDGDDDIDGDITRLVPQSFGICLHVFELLSKHVRCNP